MGISEFTVHNVLRTYTRQERIGQVQRNRPSKASSFALGDRVSLSHTGQKVQWLRHIAEDVTARQYPDLSQEDRSDRIRNTREELLFRHRDDIGDDSVSLETFESRLRALYLD